MKLILYIIFLAYLLTSFVVRSEGYYWRDYYGEIPKDAFPGGSDLNGVPIYIGQALFGKLLVPSKIYGSNKKVYFEFGGTEHEGTDQVKILCTQNPEQLEWIPTDIEKIKILTYAHLIIGGYEPEWTTYIGRVRSNGEIVVGKVITDNPTNPGCGYWGMSNGKSVHFTAFDVLSLNENAPPVFDVRSEVKKNIVKKYLK